VKALTRWYSRRGRDGIAVGRHDSEYFLIRLDVEIDIRLGISSELSGHSPGQRQCHLSVLNADTGHVSHQVELLLNDRRRGNPHVYIDS